MAPEMQRTWRLPLAWTALLVSWLLPSLRFMRTCITTSLSMEAGYPWCVKHICWSVPWTTGLRRHLDCCALPP